MGTKRRIRELLDSVGRFFSDVPERKKLRKAKHLEGFIQQLEAKQGQLEAELKASGADASSDLAEDLAILSEQTRKARKLLAKLREA